MIPSKFTASRRQWHNCRGEANAILMPLNRAMCNLCRDHLAQELDVPMQLARHSALPLLLSYFIDSIFIIQLKTVVWISKDTFLYCKSKYSI
jgi:hypothetical protein